MKFFYKSIPILLVVLLLHLKFIQAQCSGKIDITASGGYAATIINDTKGNVFGFGNNIGGQIGNNTKDNIYTVPTQPLLPANIKAKQVAKGTNTSLVLTCDKTVYAFGSNSKGQAGVAVSSNSALLPVPVDGGLTGAKYLGNVKFIDADGENGYAIMEDGSLMSWGAGAGGELGNNSTQETYKPVYVLKSDGSKLQNVVSVSGSVAVTSDGVIWTWGSNQGRRSKNDLSAVKLTQENGNSLPAISQVTKGTYFYLALDKNGNVWSWGEPNSSEGKPFEGINFGRSNQFEQLGRSSGSYSHPYKVEGGATNSRDLSDVVHIAAGEFYSLASLKSGEVVGWGVNKYYSSGAFGGQLAKGNLDNSSKPTFLKTNATTNLKNIARVYAGSAWTLAVSKDDKIFVSGYNQEGQLGLGNKESKLYATQLELPLGKDDSEIQDIIITNATICGGKGTVEFKIKQLKKNTYDIDIDGDGIYDLKAISEKGSKYSVEMPIGTLIKNVTVRDQDGIVSPPYTQKNVVIGGPVAPNFSVALSNTTGCGKSDGYGDITNLIPNTDYTVTAKLNGQQLMSTPLKTNNNGNIRFDNLSAGSYTDLSVKLASGAGCEKVEPGPYKISDPAKPTFSVGKNDPSCSGNDGKIILNGLLNTTSYVVSYSKNGIGLGGNNLSSNGTGFITISNLGSGTYTNVKVSLNGCEKTDNSTITLTAPSAPTFTVAKKDPSCGATNGNITITGLQNNTTYALSYLQNSNGTNAANYFSNSSGSITLSNLSSGTYTNIKVSLNGCEKTDPNSFTLTSPSAPTFTVAKGTDPSCTTNNGSITISGLQSTAAHSVSYSKDGTAISAVSLTPSSGVITLSNLGSGSYTNIKVSLNGCEKTDNSTITLTAPTAPTFTVAKRNDPSCTTNNGSITISGLQSTAAHSVSYSKNGTAVTAVSLMPSSGVITLSNLGSGSYTNVKVSLNGCEKTDPNSFTLTSPSAATFTVAKGTDPNCTTNNGSITISGLQSNASHSVSYSKNGTALTAVSLTPSSGVITLSNLGSGTYTNIKVSLNGCEKTDNSTITLTAPTVPTFTVAKKDPSCGAADGNITLSGLQNSGTYTVSYSKDGVAMAANLISNVSGAIALSSLGSGAYTNVNVSLNGCEKTDPATFTLTSPSAPTFTVAKKDPSCGGIDGNFTLSGLSNYISYDVTYTKNGSAVSAKNIVSNNLGRVLITNLSAGIYTSINVSNNGCGFTNASTFELKTPGAPDLPIADTLVKYCIGELSKPLTAIGQNIKWYNLETSLTPISTPTPKTTFAEITNYFVSQTEEGCESGRLKVKVVITDGPQFRLVTQDPSCAKANGRLTLDNLSINTRYTISYQKNGSIVAPKMYTSTNAGKIIIDSLLEGNYSKISIATTSCARTDNGTYILKSSLKPKTPTGDTLITYCVGETAKSLTAVGDGLLWYASETATTAISTPTPKTTLAKTTNYFVSQTLQGCESGRLKVKVVITDGPQFRLVTEDPSCAKATGRLTLDNLSINTRYTISYQKNGSIVAPKMYISTNAGKIIIDSLLEGNYSKINIATTSCARTDNGTYVLRSALDDELLPPIVNSPVTYCEGDTAKSLFTSDKRDTLVWYKEIKDISGLSSAPIPNTYVAGRTTYYVSKKRGDCESSRVGILVIVNPSPTFTVSTSNPTDCKKANGIISIGNLTANNKFAVSYRNDSITVVNELTSNANGIINNKNLEKGNYSKITIKSNGCSTVDPGKYLLISPTTAKTPVVKSPILYCKNALSQPLTAIGEDLLWYTSLESSGAAIAPIPSTQNSGTKDYYVSSNTGGCESLKVLITVSVREALVDAGIDQRVCENVNAINLNGKVDAITSDIIWSTTGTGRFIPSPQSLAATYQMSQSDIKAGKITLALQTSPVSGCDVSDSLSIIVLDERLKLRSVTNVNPDNGTIVVNWDDLGKDKITAPMTLSKRKISPTISDFQLLSDKVKSLDFAYTDNQVDTLSIYEYKLNYKNSCDVQLEAGIHNNIILQPKLDGDTNLIKLQWNEYKGWETGVLKYEILRKVNQEQLYNEVSTVSKSGTDAIISDIKYIRQCYVVKAIAKDGLEYSYSNEYCVGRNISLVVSNAFSPNGDNKNDVWVIEDLEYYKENQVRVYNQWNGLVFQKKGYTNDWNGGDLPDGTYYYVVEANGIVLKPGSLLIMR